MQLKAFQDNFKNIVLAAEEPDAALTNYLKNDDIPLAERIAVYRNNVVGSLESVMEQTFPMIKALVGDDFLRGMAREFIRVHPPETGNLNLYGRGFDAFIADFKPAQSLPYLPDMAAFEIAVNEAYYAPDDTAFTMEQLGAVPHEELADLVLTLRTSCQLIRSNYPLMDIRELCRNPDQTSTIDLGAGGVDIMIHRPALKIQINELETGEYDMLTMLAAGKNLGEATEAILANTPDFNIQLFLQKHMQLETFRI